MFVINHYAILIKATDVLFNTNFCHCSDAIWIMYKMQMSQQLHQLSPVAVSTTLAHTSRCEIWCAASGLRSYALPISNLHGSTDILICSCFNIDNPAEDSSLTRNVGGNCLSSMQTGIFCLPHFSDWQREKTGPSWPKKMVDVAYPPSLPCQIGNYLDVMGGQCRETFWQLSTRPKTQPSCLKPYRKWHSWHILARAEAQDCKNKGNRA